MFRAVVLLACLGGCSFLPKVFDGTPVVSLPACTHNCNVTVTGSQTTREDASLK